MIWWGFMCMWSFPGISHPHFFPSRVSQRQQWVLFVSFCISWGWAPCKEPLMPRGCFMGAGCIHVLSWFLWAVVTKKPQMGQLTITDVHSLKGLETRSPRSGCHRGPDSSEDSRGASVPCLSFRKGIASGIAGSPWCALTYRCITPASASSSHALLLCVYLSSSYKDTCLLLN